MLAYVHLGIPYLNEITIYDKKQRTCDNIKWFLTYMQKHVKQTAKSVVTGNVKPPHPLETFPLIIDMII